MVKMTNKIVEYKDLIAFHPGQYVGELIEGYNLSKKNLRRSWGYRQSRLEN